MQSLAVDQQIVAELGTIEPESIAHNILNYCKVPTLYLIKTEKGLLDFLCPLPLPSLPK